MPTTSTDQHAPAPDVPGRGLFSARASAISIVVASMATLGVVFVMLNAGDKQPPQVQSIPAQPNTVSQWVAAPAADKPAAATPSPQAPAPVIDGQGFVDTAARCDAAARAVAIARTARSAVVVCRDPDGSYEYQGVRLRDGAALTLDDVRPMAVGFEARNGGTTYRLSPTELVVISGETLQTRDAVVEYRTG